MKAKKSYKNGGKTKVTGAKTSKYTSEEKKMRDRGARSAGITKSFSTDAYRLARKDPELSKKVGTPQNPSAYVGGLREGSSGPTSTIPMRKRTVRSLETSGGPKKELKKSTAKIPVPPSKKRKKKLRRRK
tara:strand:- start:224 stop:613 length:390 start_codon:yes stop_codon:yes gene_type:complete